MKTRNNNERGITLIAVVITIIILLILAAVTLGAISGDNGLIARTKDAKAQHETVTANEDEQVAALRNTAKDMQGNEETMKDRTGIKVGDYIDYQPDPASAYPKSKINNGASATEDLTQESLKWQILKMNNNGSMDIIGSPISQSINFSRSKWIQ